MHRRGIDLPATWRTAHKKDAQGQRHRNQPVATDSDHDLLDAEGDAGKEHGCRKGFDEVIDRVEDLARCELDANAGRLDGHVGTLGDRDHRIEGARDRETGKGSLQSGIDLLG